MPRAPKNPPLEDLVWDLIDAQEAVTAATARLDAAKARIRAAAPMGKTQVGDTTLTLSPNRTFNQTKAIAAIPEGMLPMVSTTKTAVDPKKVAVIFENSPDVIEACYTTGEPTVRLT